jgi:kexin
MHVRKSLLVCGLLAAVATCKLAKREWGTYDYYVLEHDQSSGVALEEVTSFLGVDAVEPAGELPHHWVVRSLKAVDIHGALLSARKYDVRAASGVAYLEKQVLRQRVKRDESSLGHTDLVHDRWTERGSADVAAALGLKDPEFPHQWHLVNDEFPENSMNVSGLWELGITGKGIISAMVDDGVDYTSDDLSANFVRPSLLITVIYS